MKWLSRATPIVLALVAASVVRLALLVHFPQLSGGAGGNALTVAVYLAVAALIAIAARVTRGGRQAWPVSTMAAGAMLVGVAGLFQPVAGPLTWTWAAAAGRREWVRPFEAAAWNRNATVFELHDRATNPGSAARAFADLADLGPGCDHELTIWAALPPLDSTSTRIESAELTHAVRVVVRDNGSAGSTALGEVVLPGRASPQVGRWHRLKVRIPQGTSELVVEASPAEPAAEGTQRVWLNARPAAPVLLGTPWSPAAIRVVRAAALASGFLAAVTLMLALLQRRRIAMAAEVQVAAPAVTAERWVAGAGAFIAAILLYLPAVLATYGLSDDYAGLYLAHHDSRQIQAMLFACGRFISGVLFPFAFAQVDTVGELSYLRAIAAVGMAGLATALTSFLFHRGWTGSQAAALALMICTTPSAALTVGWTQLFPLPLALLLTLAAFGLQRRAASKPWWKSLIQASAAAGVLSAAFWIYQPCAMFYLIWLILDHLPTRAAGPRRSLAGGIRALLVFGVGAAAPYLSIALQRTPNPRAAPVTHLAEKLRWFVEEPLRNAGGLFQLAPAPAVSAVVATIVVLGIICYVSRGQRRSALAVIGMLAATPVVYLPNLMVADNWAAYRSMFCLAALMVVIAAFALRGILAHPAALSSIMVGVAALAAAFFSDQTRRGLIGPQVLELRLTQQILERHAAEPVSAIHVIQPQWMECAVDHVLYDEFGVATTLHPWTPPYFIWSATRDDSTAHLRALGELPVTSSTAPLSEPRAGVLQIDLRELKAWRMAMDWLSPP